MLTDELKELPTESLSRGQFQPRLTFDQTALRELADSILEQGIIEPIIVRLIATNQYEIVAGERRWRAAQLAGLTKVACIIREYSDEQAAEVTIIENIQREDLNPIEEAKAMARLTHEFSHTHEELAFALGKSRTKITNMLRLLQLNPNVQQLLTEKKLSEGHGKILAGIENHEQFNMAQKCINNNWSVRQLETIARKLKHSSQSSQNNGDPNIERLERIAADRFNAEVKLEDNKQQKSGWLKIKYYDYETLSGILEKMGIELEKSLVD